MLFIRLLYHTNINKRPLKVTVGEAWSKSCDSRRSNQDTEHYAQETLEPLVLDPSLDLLDQLLVLIPPLGQSSVPWKK